MNIENLKLELDAYFLPKPEFSYEFKNVCGDQFGRDWYLTMKYGNVDIPEIAFLENYSNSQVDSINGRSVNTLNGETFRLYLNKWIYTFLRHPEWSKRDMLETGLFNNL